MRKGAVSKKIFPMRISEKQLAMIEKFRQKMEADLPGVEVSTSDAMRTLIAEGLKKYQ